MTITMYHRCKYPRQTAGERLEEARWIKRIEHDRYAGQRAREEAHYIRLVRIGRGPGPLKRTNYAGTRGSGYNAKKRAQILLHAFDSRRLNMIRRANAIL